MTHPEHSSNVTCKNCQVTFEGKFCPNCSQRADTHRFTLKHFGHEFFHALTHTDKGIFFLTKELLFRPGKASYEYNSGKRKKYFNPITFLLIVTAVQIFVAKKTDLFPVFNKKLAEMVTAASVEGRQQMEKSFEETGKQTSVIIDNNKLFTIFLIPVLSFFTWIFFMKSEHNYAENLIFNVNLTSGMTLLFFLTSIIPFLIFPSLVILWMLINYLAIWVYSIIAYKQFYNQGWPITILKGVAMQILIVISSQLVSGLLTKVLS
jgi:hypothetical protein